MKDSLASTIKENRMEWDKYNAVRDQGMLEFAEIKRRLEEPSLSISQLARILELKPTTILNWDIRIIKKFKVPEPKEKKWRRFCLLDLISFSVLKDMKQRGLIIERSMNIYEYIKKDFCGFDIFTYIATGNDLAIIYDFNKADILRFNNLTDVLKRLSEIDLANNYYTSIPIGTVIRSLLQNRELQKLFDDSFRIRVMKDSKLAITLKGKEAMLKDMPDKPEKLKEGS